MAERSDLSEISGGNTTKTRAMNSSSEYKHSYELKGGKILLWKSQNFKSKQTVETQQTQENIQAVAAIQGPLSN